MLDYPLPEMGRVRDKIGKSTRFTRLDKRKAFQQLHLSKLKILLVFLKKY